MAHEFLKRAGINAAAGQGITSSVAQHVSVDREWQFSSPTSTGCLSRSVRLTARALAEGLSNASELLMARYRLRFAHCRVERAGPRRPG
jgi:hypothetical protein